MKTVGTLKEIGAQVGDVVEWFGPSKIKFTVRIEEDFVTWSDRNYPYWRIVTRAAKSPIRTIVRKEIVPGMYGWVNVSDKNADGVRISFAVARMSAADLSAAIATLTEIRDVMAENSQ